MKKTSLKFGLLAAALCAATQGHAGDLYVGAALGPSKVNVVDCSGINCETSDTGFKVFGGFRLAPELSVEALYVDFGQASAGNGLAGLTLKSTAYGAGIAYQLKLAPQWSAVGRLGIASVDTTLTGSLNVLGLSGSGSRSNSTTQPYYGLAVNYAVNRELSVQAAWDASKGEIYDASGRLEMFSIGLAFDF